MKTVYFVRHGESTENIRSTERFLGPAAELTELGRKQAHLIAARARRLPVEVIISSPYVRARQTAAEVAEAIDVPVEECDLFIEHRTPQSFVGRVWNDDLRRDFNAWQSLTYTKERYLDGENFDDMRERAEKALAYLEERHENNIFVVTHGMFARVIVGLVMLQDAFIAEDLKKMEHTLITRNTGVTVIRRGTDDDRKNGDMWHMLTWNDHAHL